MSNTWLGSDFHLNQPNIAGPNTSTWKTGYRDFGSVEEMNETIIGNINKYVKPNDTIFYHGDFCFGGHTKTPEWRRAINCQNIHFICGNHDNHIHLYRGLFNSVNDILHKTLIVNGRKIPFVMCHYAMRIWQGSHKGFYHTYGHSHDSLDRLVDKWGNPIYYGKSMDVGIDAAYRLLGEYRPFNVEEVVAILDKREIAFPDHHSLETNVK